MIFLPFLIELFGDWWLIRKGKKDIPLWVRVVLVALVSLVSVGSLITFSLSKILLASAPFALFDPALSWLRGKRGLDYVGQTKWWDKFVGKFNPRFVLWVRIILFVLTVTLGLVV